MTQNSLVKAVIKAVDPAGEPVEVMFNPKEYTFSRTLEWKDKTSAGQDVPRWEFMGGKSADLRMTLHFDTYEAATDVRKTYIDKLWKMTLVDEATKNAQTKKARPPIVQFQWGQQFSFKAVIAEMSVRFTMFLPDGMPVRAVVDITFRQAKQEGKYPWQNPTSRGLPGTRVRRVREAETLDWIAHEELGDPRRWREIAELNGLDDPLAIQAGQPLVVSGEG